MARYATLNVIPTGAWEEWTIWLPDYAPNPVTLEWLNAHEGEWHMEVLEEASADSYSYETVEEL